MDPATIFQIVGTAVSLGDVVLKCITGLSSLKTKYHDAPIHISTMIGQLYIVQTALDQLSVSNGAENDRHPRYRQLASQIGNSLDSFGVLVLALQKQLDQFDSPSSSNMAAKGRIKFLWSEKELADYSSLLDRQVNALSLLLQAIQCQTWTQQQSFMRREESQSVLTLAKDCSSSIFGLDDTRSFISETTADISVMFDFDTLILSSRIYQQAGRSHLRQAIKARNGHRATPTMESIEDDDANTAIPVRDETPGDTADERREGESDDQNGNDELAPRGSLDRQSPAAQITQKRLFARPHEQATNTLTTISSSKSVRLAGPPRQLSTFRLSNWWRKSPRRKDIPDWTPQENAPTPKILILGTSESGKSTLLKALRLCLQEPYTLDERLSYREIIWSNVVQSARVVLEAMESLELPLENDTNEYHVQTIFMQPSQYEDCPPGSEVIHAVKLLWDDAGFQDAFNRRREYQLPDSFRYYAIDVERIMSPDYVPTNEDIFRSRVKTTGITESSFLYNDLGYKVFDVGGVRSERKKWIHVFGNISTVAFTIDAHSYAKILFEDETVNRMQEQLHLFDSVVNSRWFQESSFIIVFTKIDMLEEWLQTNPAEQYFPGYSRNSSLGLVESYMQYLGDRFMSLIQSDAVLKRTRVLHINLVEDSRGPGLEVWGSVEELAHSRQLGTTLEAQSGNLS